MCVVETCGGDDLKSKRCIGVCDRSKTTHGLLRLHYSLFISHYSPMRHTAINVLHISGQTGSRKTCKNCSHKPANLLWSIIGKKIILY